MKNQYVISIIVVVILFLPILIYVMFFHNLPIGDPSNWSSFGSFYGGVLGPIITAITTLLLIYITTIIAKNEENRQKEFILSEYRQNVINKLVSYQQSLNNIKSQFWVKKLLLESQITKNKYEYNNLSSWDKGTPEIQKSQQDKKNDLELSIKLFYADIIYNIAEIKAYFENFETNHTLLFNNNYTEKGDFTTINSELNLLEDFLKNHLIKVDILIPQNIPQIESEISKLINLITNKSKNNVKL